MRGVSWLQLLMKIISRLRERLGHVDKNSFYEGKTLVSIEWYVSYCSEYPDLAWARLRVYSDGGADAAFDEAKVYGFADRESATNFLCEDEYTSFASMDEAGAAELGARKSDMQPPSWPDDPRAEFKYIGAY
jgi:hypothetical protein